MKRSILAFLILFSFHKVFSQANLVVEAPLNNNTNGTARGPNGTINHTYYRGCYLALQSELFNIPNGTNITSFGFTLTTGTAGSAASGNFTVYLQNTTDLSYNKGTTYATALTGMNPYFASVMNIPLSAVTTSIMLTLSSPFNYTGGGIYVAYDWYSPGPYATTNAIYLGDNGILPLPAGGGANFFSTTSAPTTMTLTNSRPSFLFGFTNANSNDIQVVNVEAAGNVVAPFNTGHIIKAYVKNISTVTKTGINVNLNVSGANIFSNSQPIASLAAGAGQFVSFATFNPQVIGINTLSVSVGSDQNNLNNSATYTQSVTCNKWSLNPPVGTYTANQVGFSTGTGIIVTPYTNPVNSSMVSIRGAVSTNAATVGQQLCGALLSSAGVIIAMTNTITVTSIMLGTFQDFVFSSPQLLTASTSYFFGLVQVTASAAPGAFPFGTVPAYIQPTTLYSYCGTTGGAMTLLTANYGYFGLEAVFADITNLAIVSTPSAVCAGSCAVLSAPAVLTTYTWSTGNTSSNINACPPAINSYSIIGTNTMGCKASGVVSIPVNPLPIVTISASTNTLCIGNSVTFTANGAVSYSLNNIASPASVTQTPVSLTGYTFTGMDANGCLNTASLSVDVFSLTVVFPPNGAVCKGKTITLSASGNYNYSWTDGTIVNPFQNASFTPSVTTTITVTATDVNNCSLTSTVLITVNPNPTVTATASKTLICVGEVVTLTGHGATTYTWNNTFAGPTMTLAPITATSYIVVGSTTAGCTHSVTGVELVQPCTAINETNNTSAGISIFPNPGNGIFNVVCESFEKLKIVEIYNTLGSLVKRVEIGAENTRVDLSAESSGIYLFQVIENNKVSRVNKVVKE